MVDLTTVIANLRRIDWDFPRAGTALRSVHTTHWFPGNFIPQIPAALVQILSEPGDLVLDQFAGSGTTGIEAWRLGRRSLMSDSLSSALLIMEGKIAASGGGLSDASASELLERLTWDYQCRTDAVGRHGEGSAALLSDWFSPATLAQLRYLWQLIEDADAQLRAVLLLLFSDVLFSSASAGPARTSTGGVRRHHWGWVADNVRPKALVDHDVIAAFRDRLTFAARLERLGGIRPLVFRQDARELALASESVDLIVTSPPYIGMIDYAHANRLLYGWMGWSLPDERQQEIGARYKRERRSILTEYIADMDRCWVETDRVLKPGGYCAVVLGESRKFPGAVDTVFEALAQRLDVVWGPTKRMPSRRRVSDREASQSTEQIAVFRKPC